jgi:hypothetical protein
MIMLLFMICFEFIALFCAKPDQKKQIVISVKYIAVE